MKKLILSVLVSMSLVMVSYGADNELNISSDFAPMPKSCEISPRVLKSMIANLDNEAHKYVTAVCTGPYSELVAYRDGLIKNSGFGEATLNLTPRIYKNQTHDFIVAGINRGDVTYYFAVTTVGNSNDKNNYYAFWATFNKMSTFPAAK
ncbi:MAG: hypothetical protein LBV04_02800 [Deferribacteraceae bacterium]|jgi:hypothetical protein|nr:hypothetical protein [Deferribacteraceae bacterium]